MRVKDLKDLTFPPPPSDAGQARGYVNQVLLAIGRLQKTHGNELSLWVQECLPGDEKSLGASARFPRTDREICTKLLKTRRRGKFGVMFQQLVEKQRLQDGHMPCGRIMLHRIFKHFQLERDRIGMLGERNLLTLRLGGSSIADLEAFKDKYEYILTTIPLEDLPRESTLYNHLLDELERCTVLQGKVAKSREAKAGSHKKTAKWLWEKAETAIDLARQKQNRTDFDKQLKQKPYANEPLAGALLEPSPSLRADSQDSPR